jgi:hypothetical protein
MYGEKCGYQLKVRWVDKEVKVSIQVRSSLARLLECLFGF